MQLVDIMGIKSPFCMQTNFKNPKLYDGGGSLDSRWYVYYSFKSPDDGKFRLFKVFISSNTESTFVLGQFYWPKRLLSRYYTN